MFPQGTMRKSGAAALGVAPIVGMIASVAVRLLGVGDECTDEAIQAGCMTAEQIGNAVGGLVTSGIALVGGVLYWKGFNRANPPKP